MTDKEAIKYLQQLYPNGGHCWLDEQRIEAIGIAIQALREPVSIWHDASKETPAQGSNILMIRKEEGSDFPPIAGCFHGKNSRLDGRNWGYYNGFCYNEIELPLKWAYVDDLLNLSNVQRTAKYLKEEPQVKESAEIRHEDRSCKENGSSLTHKPISIAEKMYRELPATIKGSIGWYNGFYLDYDGNELCQAIEKMMLNAGDQIKITISKVY